MKRAFLEFIPNMHAKTKGDAYNTQKKMLNPYPKFKKCKQRLNSIEHHINQKKKINN